MSTINAKYNAQSLDFGDKYLPVSRVTLMWGEGDDQYFTAGDDTGREIVGFCPSATQAMANAVLASLTGIVYRPMEADRVEIDPSAEIGDMLKIAGKTSTVAHLVTDLDTAAHVSDVSAPSKAEEEPDWPEYEPQMQKELKRRVSFNQSYYGTAITREKGIEIQRVVGSATEAAVLFNADRFRVAQGGETKLDFDYVGGRFLFGGTLYATGTLISPEIEGDEIYADNAFIVRDSGTVLGYMGPGSGYAEGGSTPGVLIANGTPGSAATIYVIATSAGARMQAGGASIYVYEGAQYDHAVMSAGGHTVDVSENGVIIDGINIEALDARVTALEEAE